MEFESFSFNQNCIATGVPTPTITWASNTSTLNVVGNRLSIRARHLNKKIVNVFTCTATNSVGRDAKQILIMNTIELSIPAKPAVISISTNSEVPAECTSRSFKCLNDSIFEYTGPLHVSLR